MADENIKETTEPTEQTTATSGGGDPKSTPAGDGKAPVPQEDEKKFSQKELDEHINRRLERERKNQPTKEELEAFRSWKDAQKTPEQKKAEQDNALADAQKEAAALRSQVVQMRLEAALNSQALAMGVDAANIGYIAKLADTSGAVDENGDISTDKLTAAINKVLADIPALKVQSSGSKGFQQIGADSSDAKQPTADEKLRRAFGLKN